MFGIPCLKMFASNSRGKPLEGEKGRYAPEFNEVASEVFSSTSVRSWTAIQEQMTHDSSQKELHMKGVAYVNSRECTDLLYRHMMDGMLR